MTDMSNLLSLAITTGRNFNDIIYICYEYENKK